MKISITGNLRKSKTTWIPSVYYEVEEEINTDEKFKEEIFLTLLDSINLIYLID